MDSAGAQLTGQPSVDEQVHIVSWNVAGWKSTVEQLRRFNGGVSSFMDKHHIDILCLQEVKLMSKTIEADATKLNVNVPGFESFWACNEGSGGQRQGFNGVATFVRQGLVLRADAAPLKDPALDAEGRCLLTDHGSFALFNVYVPNTSDASRLPYKLRWLRALKEAMRRTRSAGKGVILVGDLNMKHRVSDSHWVSRTINVPRLMQLSPECSALQPDVQKAIDTICREWPNMCAALRQKEHRYFETKRHGQTFQRWGVFAKDQSGQSVRVGSPCECEDSARRSYCVDGVGVGQDGTVICGPDAADAAYVLQQPGELCMVDLVECLKRLAGVDLGTNVQRQIVNLYGSLSQSVAEGDWFQGIFKDDGMVDAFAELRPEADERFTCWNQQRGLRHVNVGSRIDYMLVDKSFFEQYALRGGDLYAPGQLPPDSLAAALAAANLGGQCQPSSLVGGGTGMPELEEDEYFAQFRSEGPHTGILYTPPQLSDHVATSLLLGNCSIARGQSLARDATTQRCQPHRSSKRITDFFARKREAPNNVAEAPLEKRSKIGVQ